MSLKTTEETAEFHPCDLLFFFFLFFHFFVLLLTIEYLLERQKYNHPNVQIHLC